MRVKRGELPHQFVVSMPQRRDYRGWQSERLSQPVDPAVEVHPLGQRFVGRQQIPVDRAQRLIAIESGGRELLLGNAVLRVDAA